jgi:Fic family protein
MYIYQRKEWPDFYWDREYILGILAEVKYIQGKLLGRMINIGFDLQVDANLETLISDIVKTSKIEGEIFKPNEVRSSVSKRLGIDQGGYIPTSRDVDGIVEMTLDAINNHHKSLTKERLCNWHSSIFPTERVGMQMIKAGQFRDESSGPMEVVSGPFGKEKVHFKAPNFDKVDYEMKHFLKWYNEDNEDLIIKAAIAHFWFITIHPFDDGNGRIARIISDMTLARSEASNKRFYSMSTSIEKKRQSYYSILESLQKGGLDITKWLDWFLEILMNAIKNSDVILERVLHKAKFWQSHSSHNFNDRQKLILNKLFDEFEGNLTSSKWAKITKCSQDTALRDINDLMEMNILRKDISGGRSTSYLLLDSGLASS